MYVETTVCVCVCACVIPIYSPLMLCSVPLLSPLSPPPSLPLPTTFPPPSLPLSYGAPVTWQSAVFMWWAGLRGAVGRALGIQFYRSRDQGTAAGFVYAEDASQMLLHICMVALCTLSICAPTGKLMLQKLRLIGEDDTARLIRRDVEAMIHNDAASRFKQASVTVIKRV